jgi:hypothetical protein
VLLEPLQNVFHRRAACRFQGAKFVPGQRDRHRRSRPRPHGVIRNGGGGVVVTEIIDKDLACSFRLAHRSDIRLGCIRRHFVGHSGSECLDCRPPVLAGQRHGDVQSLAARAFESGFEPLAFEPLPQILRGELQCFKRNIRRRIEIKDETVGIINRIDRGAPWMNFNRAHLMISSKPFSLSIYRYS